MLRGSIPRLDGSCAKNHNNWENRVAQASRRVIDWLIEQGLTSPPTQYRLYGRRFLQVTRPNQQYQSTEGTPCVSDTATAELLVRCAVIKYVCVTTITFKDQFEMKTKPEFKWELYLKIFVMFRYFTQNMTELLNVQCNKILTITRLLQPTQNKRTLNYTSSLNHLTVFIFRQWTMQ